MPNSKPKDGVPGNQEFSQLKQYMITMRPDGWERADWVDHITEICGDDVNERSRKEIISDLRAWMKEFPKA